MTIMRYLTGMTQKNQMVSVRLPAQLVARVDFVVRNSEPDVVKNRTSAVHAALLGWLPGEETRLEVLGIIPKKTAR